MGKKAFVLSAAAEEGNFIRWSGSWINPYLGKLITSQRSCAGKQPCSPKYKHHSGMGSNLSIFVVLHLMERSLVLDLPANVQPPLFYKNIVVSSAWKRRQWPLLSFAVQCWLLQPDLRTLPSPLPTPAPATAPPPWHLIHPSQDTSSLCQHMNHQTHHFSQHCRALSLLPGMGTSGMLGDTMRCHFPWWHLSGCSRNSSRSIRHLRQAERCWSVQIFCSNSYSLPPQSKI